MVNDPSRCPGPPASQEEPATPAQLLPRCPRCGWHDVRFSYTRKAFDFLFRVISVERFKCRTCGAHFRRRWFGSRV